MNWQGIRIDHHDNDHSALLLEAVRPLVAQLRADSRVESVLVRTHWANGPHVLISVAADPDVFAGEIYPAARAQLLEWLGAHPSCNALDQEAYAVASEGWARAEGFALADPSLFPNNSVASVAVDAAPPMGLETLGDVRDRFQASVLDTVWHLLNLRQANKAAFLAECACMIAAVGVVTRDARFDFWPTSMRAHLDGYLANDPAAHDRFEVLHQRMGQALDRRMITLGLLGNENAAGPTYPPHFGDWLEQLRSTLSGIDAVVDQSHQHLVHHDVYANTGSPFAGKNASWLARVSMALMQFAFMRAIMNWLLSQFANASWSIRRAAIMRTKTHLQFRILINLIYGLFPLLGIGPTERASLCHLIWRSCETSFPQVIERARASVDQLAGRAIEEGVA